MITDPETRIFRSRQLYTGPAELPPVPSLSAQAYVPSLAELAEEISSQCEAVHTRPRRPRHILAPFRRSEMPPPGVGERPMR
jgi:hypothetical protein